MTTTQTAIQISASKSSLGSMQTSSKNKKEKPIQHVANKALKDAPKASSKKVKASLWSRIGKCFRKFFSCWCCCFGKNKKDESASSFSPSHTSSLENTTSNEKPIPEGNVFEALQWIKPKSQLKTTPIAVKPGSIKPTFVRDWRKEYLDYVPRDLKELGLAIEEIHECPELKVHVNKNPIAKSDKKYSVHNPIFFKGFANMQIRIVHQDLFRSAAEVIVNAANRALCGGGGIDGAIHNAGGEKYQREHWNLRRHYDGNFTSGYAAMIKDMPLNRHVFDKKDNLIETISSIKDVIVVAGPCISKATPASKTALYSCYMNSLALAHLQNKKSIAFPAVSTGIFNYPKSIAAEISLRAIYEFIKKHPDTSLTTIDIHCFDPNNPDEESFHKELMFYHDVVNAYPDIITTEIVEDGSKPTT